jgi:hypothetical protein
MRAVGLLCLLVPAIASADDLVADEAPAARISVGFKVVESFPRVSFEAMTQPRQFGTAEQNTPVTEVDVPVAITVTPWLRAVPLVGFTDLTLDWNADCPPESPCLTRLAQDDLVIGAGGQVFHRFGGWETYGDVTFRALIPVVRSAVIFALGSGGYDGMVGGGDSVAVTAGIARRVDTARLFLEAGYMHTVVPLEASMLGLSASFGSFEVAAGITLW